MIVLKEQTEAPDLRPPLTPAPLFYSLPALLTKVSTYAASITLDNLASELPMLDGGGREAPGQVEAPELRHPLTPAPLFHSLPALLTKVSA